MMYKGKDVIIVGGGNSAIADALYLEKICKSVTLIPPRFDARPQYQLWASQNVLAALGLPYRPAM